MLLRLLLLTAYSAVLFTGGTYTGWRAARWLDPVLDARDRNIAVQDAIGGWFDD